MVALRQAQGPPLPVTELQKGPPLQLAAEPAEAAFVRFTFRVLRQAQRPGVFTFTKPTVAEPAEATLSGSLSGRFYRLSGRCVGIFKKELFT